MFGARWTQKTGVQARMRISSRLEPNGEGISLRGMGSIDVCYHDISIICHSVWSRTPSNDGLVFCLELRSSGGTISLCGVD
jgi:hypothetical protein